MRDKILILYAIAVVLGVLTGMVGSFFQLAVVYGIHFIELILKKAASVGLSATLLSMLISMCLVFISWLLVRGFAPEAAGSGVQEIEGTLLHERPIFWRRLLPVKFIGGVMAISAKLVLGREGPTIQMGGNLGEMLGELLRLSPRRCNTLIAAGSAAGLASAFNAPLAGVLFVLEEMRSQFDFSFTNFKTVAISCVMATITLHFIIGPQPAIPMSVYALPSLKSLWLFFIFGIVVGFVGLIFNKTLMATLALTDKLTVKMRIAYVLLLGAAVGYLAQNYPEAVGGGYEIIEQALTLSPPFSVLLLLIVLRFLTTMTSYSTSVPGGIFAPMLALGTLLGLACAYIFAYLLQGFVYDESIHPGMFAVAGMGALFSAAVRAPITGIILVVEMTQNYSLILPLMVTCLTSTTIVQLAGNEPIYTQLLERTLRRSRTDKTNSVQSKRDISSET
ncbi:voltage-gated chloride channel protein (ClC-type) [Legionella lansingensis]|uniref:Voltage-gated chloride channel protein (ClC-type) n=1 Tax=Legionella lansingensis TaxID=45067 RepID=A0A0W0VHJ4_9GAMM|nr:H(+)/Cl(-) exchange transporter ClcA [Legionella lansingensis]KTD19309.1 voltage-gated chloride channel protein (ClC-type) [Legionella lansingensis]SNV50438.1 voltage-gated chloride channel protein (ClC-type) [Legionella lansingensis]